MLGSSEDSVQAQIHAPLLSEQDGLPLWKTCKTTTDTQDFLL